MSGCPWCPRLYPHQELLRLFNVLQGPSGFEILNSIIGKIISNNQKIRFNISPLKKNRGVSERTNLLAQVKL